jgi:glucosamine--fructose-6-phosphate aminotransferase (isomerizing)
MTKLLQDIHREPEELSKSLVYSLGEGRPALEAAAEIIRKSSHIYIVGIGSSWHAGMATLAFFNTYGRPASLLDASEMLHFSEVASNSVVIVLSRSGKSVEIVQLLGKLPSPDSKIIAVTNTLDNPLAAQADVCLPLHANFDHLVSITMYSGLALVGSLLASMALGVQAGHLVEELRASLAATQRAMAGWQDEVEASDWLASGTPTYLLARGGSLSSCHEARLLWEEVAKAPASALPTGSFRHGPQEVIHPGLRVGMWVDGLKMRPQDLTLAKDLRGHGAKVLLIGQELAPDAADLVMNIPTIPAVWQFLIDIIPIQLASERLARLRGEDCDSFRMCPYIIEEEGRLTSRVGK